MKLAADGINGCLDHFATAAQQSQYIDEFVVAPTQARAHHFRVFTVLAEQFDGLGQRNRSTGIHRSTLFRSGETGLIVGGVGGDGRQAYSAEQQTGRKKSENRHRKGGNGASVNAA
jgi:hypothetical protein